MSRNGSGVYTLPVGNPVVTATPITVTWANSTLSDVATEITNSLDKGGRTAPTANLPMAGFKHTGSAVGAAAGEPLTFGQAGSLSSLSFGLNGAGVGYLLTDTFTVDGAVVPQYGMAVAEFDATKAIGPGLWLSGYGEVRIGNQGITVLRIISGGAVQIPGSLLVIGGITGTASAATLATKASALADGGGNGGGMIFTYAGNAAQPTWLWGTTDGVNSSVWNPSNFIVTGATWSVTSDHITNGSYNGFGVRTVSTGDPSGGTDGDIWYKY